MMEHNDKVELLINFIKDRLDKKEREEVKKLLKSDSETAELYAIVRNLLEESDKLKYNHLPEAAQKMAEKIYEDFQQRQGSPDLPVGVTVFDSRLLPLPDGVRPASVKEGRVKYRLNGLTLELSLYPVSSDSFEIIGQVSGADEGVCFDVELTGGRKKYTVTTDQFHLFRFERISSGKYELSLLKDQEKIGIVSLGL